MKKYRLSNHLKRWLIALHIICMATWLGGTLAMFLLNLAAMQGGASQGLYMTYLNINLLDDVFIKSPALLTLVSGLLLSAFTNWGLIQYRWIIVKEVLTVAVIAFGIFGVNHWLDRVTALVSTGGLGTAQLTSYMQTNSLLLAGAAVNILAMAGMVIISSVKPWGKVKG
jgi:hypothetical protein